MQSFFLVWKKDWGVTINVGEKSSKKYRDKYFKLRQIKRDKMWWNRGIQFNKADHESRIFKQYYRHKKYGCQAIWTLLCMYRLLIAVPTV